MLKVINKSFVYMTKYLSSAYVAFFILQFCLFLKNLQVRHNFLIFQKQLIFKVRSNPKLTYDHSKLIAREIKS
jgi:hypothetical protein